MDTNKPTLPELLCDARLQRIAILERLRPVQRRLDQMEGAAYEMLPVDVTEYQREVIAEQLRDNEEYLDAQERSWELSDLLERADAVVEKYEAELALELADMTLETELVRHHECLGSSDYSESFPTHLSERDN